MLAAPDPFQASSSLAATEQVAPDTFVERGARLVTILLVARLVTPVGDALVRIRNMSSGGLMLETSVALTTDDQVRVELRNLQSIDGRVAWARNGRAGIQFAEPVNVADLLHPSLPKGRGARVARAPRLSTCCAVQILHQGRSCRALLTDLSQKGGRLETTRAMAVGDQLTVALPGMSAQRAVVRWQRDEGVGVVFLDAISFGELDRWLQDEAVRFGARETG